VSAFQKALQVTNRSLASPRARVITDPQEKLNASLAQAAKLQGEGKLQEALEEYLKCYHDLAINQDGRADQQIVMSAIQRFGKTYPAAMVALRELRDTAMTKMPDSSNRRDVINEIALLNERLGDGGASMALYDSLPLADPGRQAIGLIAHNSFVAARRYSDALVGEPFGEMINQLEMQIRFSANQAPESSAMFHDIAIKGALSDIEVLTGAGRIEDARTLTEKLLAYDGSEATRVALKLHVDRASQSVVP
jgi:hypothetical protein